MKIAIIGAGVSGNTVAYRLHEKHDITIFEAEDYIGGHVNTIDVVEDESVISVDRDINSGKVSKIIIHDFVLR